MSQCDDEEDCNRLGKAVGGNCSHGGGASDENASYEPNTFAF